MNLRFAPALFAALAATAAFSPAAAGFDLLADRPLKIVQSAPVTFPATVAAQGVSEGEVRAVLQVDPQGKLLDVLVTGYTHRDLAVELVEAIRGWTFEPPMQRGEAIGARTSVAFSFEAHGIVISQTSTEALNAATNRLIAAGLTSQLCRQTELDQPLRTTHVVAPQHPGPAVPNAPVNPSAVIDFYIDGSGTPRMPAVLRASHDFYAAAAMEALLQWRFAPPTRHGEPVIVRVSQTFTFAKKSS